MKKLAHAIVLLIVLLSACAPAQSLSRSLPEPETWPTQAWLSASPESQGMDSALLAQMLEEIAQERTNLNSLLVVRNGYMVAEAYFHPYAPETPVHVQSITKSVIGMLVGKAVADGKIESAEATLVSFFPGRVFGNSSPQKESIRLSHLLSMSSGLDCQEFSADGPKMEQSNGWVQFMLDLPVVVEPGKQFGYCNGNAHLLSAILEKTTGMTAREYANQALFAPLGIPALDKSAWGSDPKGYSTGGYGLHLTPRDLAKLALLYLHNGKWDGQQLIPAAWVAESTTQHVAKEDGSGYGYLWTVYPRQGRYAALGLGGQQIHVYPKHNLIVVTTAGLPAYADAPEIEHLLAEYILPALKSGRPLPENPQSLSRLQALVDEAAHPLQPVADLPAVAMASSGTEYVMDENTFGWQTLRFEFTPGADTAQLHLNGGGALEIGLDNLFRLSSVDPLGELLLRGRWIDERTFVADYPYSITGPTRLGELGQTELRFTFTGDQLEVNIIPLIFGGETYTLTGNR